MRLSPLLLALVALPLAAQVGHDPRHTPYSDIVPNRSFSLLYGDIGGDGGRIGVGPHNGPSYGVRADLRLGAPIQFGLSVARAELERLVVSADDSVAKRVKGPVDQSLLMIEATLQLNLTGKKSWHHLAPYLSGSLGWANSSDLPASGPADSSGYRFGNKLYLAPGVGVRVMIGQTLHLRLDARQLFWKLNYPVSYLVEPADEPGTTDNPNAVIPDGKRNQWSGGRELRVGLGLSF